MTKPVRFADGSRFAAKIFSAVIDQNASIGFLRQHVFHTDISPEKLAVTGFVCMPDISAAPFGPELRRCFSPLSIKPPGDLFLPAALHHPNIGVHADLYHMADAGEPLSVLTDNAALLRHFHIAAPGTRAYPAETDGCDYAALAKTLHDAGYDRRISIKGSSPEDFAAGGRLVHCVSAPHVRMKKSYEKT